MRADDVHVFEDRQALAHACENPKFRSPGPVTIFHHGLCTIETPCPVVVKIAQGRYWRMLHPTQSPLSHSPSSAFQLSGSFHVFMSSTLPTGMTEPDLPQHCSESESASQSDAPGTLEPKKLRTVRTLLLS